MENGNTMSIIRDSTARNSVVQSKLDKAVTVTSQYFGQDWKASVGVPIVHISERFSHLETGKQEVVVTPRVRRQAVENLHEQLEKNDTLYSSAVVPLKST